MLTIDNVKVRCLVDSGAATTLGDCGIFGGLSSRKRRLRNKLKLNTLTGTKLVYEEVIVNVPLEFNAGDETMSIKLVDLKDKAFDCIIGNNVLMPMGVIIDFMNMRLLVNNVEVLFCPRPVDVSYDEIRVLELQNIDFGNMELPSHLNDEEKLKLEGFLKKNRVTFYQEGQTLSATNAVKHSIVTTSDRPVYSRIYRYPKVHEAEIETQIREMLIQGIVRPSKSPYNSPLWIVPKKLDNDGKRKWRIVIDYRNLNNITVDDKFPMPNIDSLFDKLGRAQYFSTIDLAKGFHQIKMEDRDIQKTAFSTPLGHFEYIRMPFGLKNAPSTFQRLMNYVLRDYINKICVIYMDDILVFSSSLDEHLNSLAKIFAALNEHNLKVQMNKCSFLARQTQFLGHIVTPSGLKPCQSKIEAINGVPVPRTVKQIKSFLGLTGYYRKFIRNYSSIAGPMIKYLKKDVKMNIDDPSYIEAFEKLKRIITNPPILSYPDFNKKFIVTTDASNVALGAVLSQGDRPICYASRTLNDHEKNYSTIERELLAIVWAAKYFRPYLYGTKFLVNTDHQPLKWLASLKEPNSRLSRWKIMLAEYEFDVEYVKGKENKVADFLSRLEPDNIDFEDCDERSLFAISDDMATVHSQQEDDGSTDFYISDSIVNKYRTQIRILRVKQREHEILYRKYNIIYVSENDLRNDHYLNDLFRRTLKKGKVGVYSELPDNLYFMVQEKLESLFGSDRNLNFIRCTKLAVDVLSEEEVYGIVEGIHGNGNHRGVLENFGRIKDSYFYPNLIKYVNKYINSCRICSENKYDRNPYRKHFNHTVTPDRPNMIVHMDIFQIHRTCFLTTIDKFTKLGSVHKITDKNMCTIRVKIEERIALLGKPELLVMDNEFNNALIRLFCSEKNIQTRFTTPNSHTGNSDIERMHLSLLEHIRVLKRSNENIDIEELVIRAIGFYNDTIHSATRLKPIDFINRSDIDYQNVAQYMSNRKRKAIERINSKRGEVPQYGNRDLFVKNPEAQRQKTAKRFLKYNANNPNKVDLANIKRPLKNFSGDGNVDHPGTSVGPN